MQFIEVYSLCSGGQGHVRAAIFSFKPILPTPGFFGRLLAIFRWKPRGPKGDAGGCGSGTVTGTLNNEARPPDAAPPTYTWDVTIYYPIPV